MSKQKPSKGAKQSLLDQIDADKKLVEALNDEELEMVAGGYMLAQQSTIAQINTGVVTKHNVNTGVVTKHNVNTGVVTRQPIDTGIVIGRNINTGMVY